MSAASPTSAHGHVPFARYFLYFTLAISGSACSKATDPEPADPCLGAPQPSDEATVVDTSPTWSPEGTIVAYQRLYASSAGAPGVYTIQTDGTNNRLLMEADPLWLLRLRFSPDGSQLSMIIGGEIFLLTVGDGGIRHLTNSGGTVRSADWSPDGHLVFDHASGMAIVNSVTGETRALDFAGLPVYGADPRWSPQGEPIAFWFGSRDVFTIRSDGTLLRRLTDAAADDALADDPRWIFSGTHLLYRQIGQHGDPPCQHTRMMSADGSNPQIWPLFIGFFDAISPDSRYTVTVRAQTDSTHIIEGLPAGVLFIRGIDDAAGTTLRQLTSYSPPPPKPLYFDSSWPSGEPSGPWR